MGSIEDCDNDCCGGGFVIGVVVSLLSPSDSALIGPFAFSPGCFPKALLGLKFQISFLPALILSLSLSLFVSIYILFLFSFFFFLSSFFFLFFFYIMFIVDFYFINETVKCLSKLWIINSSCC